MSVFDVILFVDFAVAAAVTVFMLIRFSAKTAAIDLSKNKRGLPEERYCLRVFHIQALKILAAAVILFVPALLGVLFGSVPMETEDSRVIAPVAVILAGTFAGGFALGGFYFHTGKKRGLYDFMCEAAPCGGGNIAGERRVLFGLGILTCMYISLIAGFALLDLLFLAY